VTLYHERRPTKLLYVVVRWALPTRRRC